MEKKKISYETIRKNKKLGEFLEDEKDNSGKQRTREKRS